MDDNAKIATTAESKIIITFAGTQSSDISIEAFGIDAVQLYGAAAILEREAHKMMMMMEVARDQANRHEAIEVARSLPLQVIKGHRDGN